MIFTPEEDAQRSVSSDAYTKALLLPLFSSCNWICWTSGLFIIDWCCSSQTRVSWNTLHYERHWGYAFHYVLVITNWPVVIVCGQLSACV